jgi:transcriptional regulator with XRE-family HTH domain
MKNPGTNIREARESAHLTLRQVADVLGRTGEWLRRIEIGTLKAKPDKLQKILGVICRLEEIRATKTAIAPPVHPCPVVSSEPQQKVRE